MKSFIHLVFRALIFSLTLVLSPLCLAESHEIFNPIIQIEINDLKAADQLGKEIREKLSQKFQNYQGRKLVVQVIHSGDILDFPRETKWIVSHIKHAETSPLILAEIQIELHLVEDEEIEEVLQDNQFIQSPKEEAENISLGLLRNIERLAENIRIISESIDSLDDIIFRIKHINTQDNHLIHELAEEILQENLSLQNFFNQKVTHILSEADWKSFLKYKLNISQSQEKLRILHLKYNEIPDYSIALPVFDQIDHYLSQILIGLKGVEDLMLRQRAQIYKIKYGREHKEKNRFLHKSKVELKRFFGLPDGIKWNMYVLSFTDRTLKEHLTEFISGFVQASAMFFINRAILVQKLVEDPEIYLDPVSGAGTAAAWKLLTGYIERANNAFFAQGNNWGPIREFSINKRFFMLGAYVHSIVIGMSVQFAARGAEGFTEDVFIHTAWNSFLGLFAKAVPLMLIAKHQKKKDEVEDSESLGHSKWMTIALNFSFGIVYQGIKALHLFQLDYLHLPTVFVGLGLSGLSYEIIKALHKGKMQVATKSGSITRFEYLKHRLQRKALFKKREDTRRCQTLLVVPRRFEG